MSVSELPWAGSRAGEPATRGEPTAYQPFIDGLRAWAVLSVMLYHLDARWLPGGFSGVDIFFVISGFVVSASVADRGPMPFGQFLLCFYARRARRILPALVVALLATALISALFIPAAYLSDRNRTTGLLAFFGLSNVILGAPGGDYFSPKAEFNPYTHTWSLGVEEQFYLLFPLLFWAWLAGGKRRHASSALFAAALGASLAWTVWAGPAKHAQAFYLIFGRFWELASGVLLYQCVARFGRSAGKPAARSAAAFGIEAGVWASAVAVLAGFVASKPALYPFPGAIAPVAGTLGLLGLLYGRAHAGPIRALLEHPALRFVGRISYSLYLWHWPVFVVFRWTAGLDSAGSKASALLVAVGLAMASYRCVEAPLRRGAAARFAVLARGACATAAGAALATMMAAAQPQLSLSTVERHRLDWYPYGIATNAAYPGCVAGVDDRDVSGGKLWIYARKHCGRPPESRHRLFVIGDSHAMAYAGMFKQFVVRTGVTVYSYNNAGCPFVSLQPWRERGDPGCRRYGGAAQSDMLSKLEPGDIVFLPSLRLPRFVTQWAFVGDDDDAHRLSFGREAAQVRERAIADAIAELRDIGRSGARIVLEAPPPVFRTVPYRCSDWFNRGNAICARGPLVSRGEIDALRAPVLAAYARIAAQVPDVHVWDPLPLLCGEKACSAYDGARPLFFDGDHISGYGNLRVLPGFEAFMRELLEAA
ncbi:acyltransferase [Burkholderia thailandensis]|uniref:acyltransferase family protein n=1 Tax=Burkholderia thailandensis TaxID=57975 RepID=UPI0008420F00|nr:acyltransferase family protein [Burkholderia thailandensis]AVR27238.1 acyltransferase [Burkholderia thailandensis]MCS3395017.1 acyltransferase [Burkholderia thailandensis]MCS6428399.1 acyltransferase [Burkholderia thailandensis]MCS6454314.1 acyltransferase [Burkholderia thailandensis]MCS6465020.1 acyltransferase [Burkholderia thailandensis]